LSKVKLKIKTAEGKVLHIIENIKDFSKFKPLILELRIEENSKTFEDTRMLRITNKCKQVLN
jgi:hypothetical protein